VEVDTANKGEKPMLVASLVVLILIAGLLMYGFCTNPKLIEIGRLMIAAALFAICFSTAGRLVTLIGR
jgi:hypothetical protein